MPSLLRVAVLPIILSACAGSETPVAAPSRVGSAPLNTAAAPADPSPPYVPPAIDAAFAAHVQRAAEIRGLAPRRPVQLKVVSRVELASWMKMERSHGAPADLDAHLRVIAIALEQLPPGFDRNAAIDAWAMSDSAAGTFDSTEDQMLVLADLDHEQQRDMLVHEAVHGLQNQHFDIERLRAWTADGGDRQLALEALIEADATSAASYASGDLPVDAESLRASWEIATPGVPRAASAIFSARYVYGLPFVHRARAKGGWDAVNQLWVRLPASTEQLLHAAKYDSNEPPEVVEIPLPPSASWTRLHTDVMGELLLLLGLREWLSLADASAAAEGWGGDRIALYSQPETSTFAVAWRIRFDPGPPGDSALEARQGRSAFAEVLTRVALGGKVASLRRNGVESWCAERTGLGPMALSARDRDVLVTAGPFTLRGAVTHSDATCAVALRWNLDALSGGR